MATGLTSYSRSFQKERRPPRPPRPPLPPPPPPRVAAHVLDRSVLGEHRRQRRLLLVAISLPRNRADRVDPLRLCLASTSQRACRSAGAASCSAVTGRLV